ncbi:MAG TPA: peptidase C13 family protein, partial [Psychrobacter sp.]|nr:peptidase C13 family protein [Psychrobacter sp.]
IGQQMNADEDVLFMTLSSHGDQDFIHLSNPPLAMDNLDATWLREALDASGIRWRVIVVSACYSGSFIDELASPTTVVITASATDKMSFGCTNSAEMTYFGQAFFAESLRGNTSFSGAFKDAAYRVKERELSMGFEPSEPQMVIGSLMETALPAFEQVLFDKTRLPQASISENSDATTVINISPDTGADTAVNANKTKN